MSTCQNSTAESHFAADCADRPFLQARAVSRADLDVVLRPVQPGVAGKVRAARVVKDKVIRPGITLGVDKVAVRVAYLTGLA